MTDILYPLSEQLSLRDVANHLGVFAASLFRAAPASSSFAGTAQFRGGIAESTTASGVLTSIVSGGAETATDRRPVGIVIVSFPEVGAARPPITPDDLDSAAAAGDQHTFAAQVSLADWTAFPPEALLRAIDHALRLELAEIAIALAQRGTQIFPDDERIRRAAQVLAPPVVRGSSPPPAHGLEASRQWLREEAQHYRGQWVAVRDGQLLGVASSPRALSALVGVDADVVSTIITKVL